MLNPTGTHPETNPVTNPEPSIDELLAPFSIFGVKLGLSRMTRLLAALGNPQAKVPCIHVAGSNGKGSVCAYLTTVLKTAGYRVGRYTSPHLVSWGERISVNLEAIALADLARLLQQVIAVAQTLAEAASEIPTQFELVTAAMWVYFAEQGVEIAVIEVGLGGRLDATNVIAPPLASVIVSISREHWQVLGETLGEIAGEKAGIFKPGCPVLVGPLPPEAQAVVQAQAAALACPLTEVEPLPEAALQSYSLPLQGAVQRTNVAIAIATLASLRSRGWVIPEAALWEGIAETRWPGRLEWITWRGRRILLDGAHNRDSMRVLRQFVETVPAVRAGLPVQWVMGMMAKKEHDAMFQAVLRSGDGLYLVPVADPATADPEGLKAIALAVCPELSCCETFTEASFPGKIVGAPLRGAPTIFPGDVQGEETRVEEALMAACERSGQGLVVLCGSLYLLGQFLAKCSSNSR